MAKPVLFTKEEVAKFRKALDGLRDPAAYQPGKFAVSNHNRRPEVMGDLPKKVILRDISLRTMQQLPGVVRPESERREFLRRLVRAGVRQVNTAGFMRKLTLDEMKAEIAAAKEVSEDCQLVYIGPMTVEDFDLVAAAGYDYVQLMSSYIGDATAVLSAPTYHRIWNDREWQSLRFPSTPGDQIERSVRLTKMALDRGLKVSAGMNLVAYASDGYVADFAGAIGAAGGQEVHLLDSSSGLSPEALAHLVRIAKTAGGGLVVGVHAHDMFGLAVAASVAAAKAGAEVLEVAVNGYVIGPAQADLAATATALEVLYGIDTGIDLSQLVPIARAGEQLTGIEVPLNYPVVGKELFALGEPDPYVEEVDVDQLLHKPFTPELVGNGRPLHITASTGPFGMWRKLDQLGVDVEKQHVMPILKECWARMEKDSRALTDAEITAIARAVLARPVVSEKAAS